MNKNITKEAGKGQSQTFKFVQVMMFALLLFLTGNTTCFATTVGLQWDAVTDSGLSGYKVYYQADSSAQPFTGTGATQGNSPIDIHNQTTATIGGLDPSHAYYFAVTAYDTSGVESSYSNIVYVPELVSPTVAISAPISGATVSGTVSVTAIASDNVGVAKLEFYLNGVLQATDTATPYVYSWNTSALAVGTYTLMAKAYDAAGNVGQSGSISVTVVNDTTSPSISMTSPSNNATVSGTVAITATASDNVGVSKVEFYENGILLFAGNVPPYVYNWNTASVANGSYILTAEAYDNAGNIGHSSNVSVTVFNDTTAPTISITAPPNNAVVSGVTLISCNAFDNVGVSKVEFYVNSALQSSSSSAPYIFNWDTTAVVNGSYAISAKVYDAASNLGQSAIITITVNNYPPQGSYTAVFGDSVGTNYPNTVQDTFININNDVNSSNTALNTYTWPANTPANAIVMKLDISALPVNAQIQSATLYLGLLNSSGDELYEIPVSQIINKQPVIAACNGNTYDGTNVWTPSSVPYGGIPLAQSDIGPVVDAPLVDKTSGYKNWNVTNIVKDWVATPSNNKGLLLNSSSKASSDSSRTFASSEAVDATLRPKFVVTYTLASDTTAPVVSAFSMPATSTTLTVAVSTFTASDAVGVTGYMISESATAPTASASGWSSAVPGSFTFSAAGSNTAYAWAKDAAGNVSASRSAVITITLPDTTAPVVSAFSMPATATTLTVAISSFMASDAVGVSGYMINESAAAPSASASGWTASAPSSFTFSAVGSRTAYAWAKDAAGNVSASRSAVVTITLPDTTAPVVSAFSMPATATTLTVAISSFMASDAVGVSGYLINESAAAPSASASGWTASAPSSFTFSTAGSRTAYAWAKDAAGNVSASRSAVVTITLPDITAPVVNSFSMPATATTLTVAVSSFTASDDIGVSGYLISESATAPSASASGWSSTAPTSFTFSAAGSKTAYAWAKDAAGNVSASRSAVVTITLPDTTAPVVSIVVRKTNAKGKLSVTATASDNVGVSKVEFYVNGSLVLPDSTAPYSYTWNVAEVINGTYSLMAKAYDSAGNIGLSSIVTVTVPNCQIR